jgi:hypothetical protein
MMIAITQNVILNAIIVWFVWGFAMGIGWAIAGWLMSKVLR